MDLSICVCSGALSDGLRLLNHPQQLNETK